MHIFCSIPNNGIVCNATITIDPRSFLLFHPHTHPGEIIDGKVEAKSLGSPIFSPLIILLSRLACVLVYIYIYILPSIS